MFGFGIWEIAVILFVALLVLGPEKLPKVARQMGRGLRELRRAANEFQSAWSSEVEDLDEVRKAGADMKQEVQQELRAIPTVVPKAGDLLGEKPAPGSTPPRAADAPPAADAAPAADAPPADSGGGANAPPSRASEAKETDHG